MDETDKMDLNKMVKQSVYLFEISHAKEKLLRPKFIFYVCLIYENMAASASATDLEPFL